MSEAVNPLALLRLAYASTFLASLVLFAPQALSAQADADSRSDPFSELVDAAREGYAARVEVLLSTYPEILGETDGAGMTPLHHAVQAGQVGVATLLLDRGADLSVADLRGRTALHHAAFEGDLEATTLLLDRGADVEARELRGRTPLFLAAGFGHELGVVEVLIRAGSDVNARTPQGTELLFSTLFYGKPEIVEALMDAGARLPEDDSSLSRSLFLAASNGYEGVFRAARREAEARGLDWWAGVSMHTTARGGSVLIGEALRDRSNSLDDANLYGTTPIHVAAEYGHAEFVRFLARNGADLDRAGVAGKTALHYARRNGKEEVVSLLLELGATDRTPVFPELSGPYLGQPEPGDSPERFAPGLVSIYAFNSEHAPAVFSPEGTEAFWPEPARNPLLVSRLENGRWTAPLPAPFSSEHGEGEPIYSPDGNRLYFLSKRPIRPGAEPGEENIWFVEREGDGWSEAAPVSEAVNGNHLHWCFSVAASGTLYFHTVREGGYGQHDIYRSRQVDGIHQEPESLGPVINSEGFDRTAYIAPDESYLIFSSTGHGAEGGSPTFFISHKGPDGGWAPPRSLAHITAPVANPLCPVITSDNRFLFFIGDGDVWWVRADFIEEMKEPGQRR